MQSLQNLLLDAILMQPRKWLSCIDSFVFEYSLSCLFYPFHLELLDFRVSSLFVAEARILAGRIGGTTSLNLSRIHFRSVISDHYHIYWRKISEVSHRLMAKKQTIEAK